MLARNIVLTLEAWRVIGNPGRSAPFISRKPASIPISEAQLQSELHQPRLIVLRGDLSELARAHLRVRGAQLFPVEQIEELRTELQLEALSNRGALVYGEVVVRNPLRAKIGRA